MRAMTVLLLVALIGIAAIGVVDSKSDNANPAAPGQTGNNPGQSGGEIGPPGQTGDNPGNGNDPKGEYEPPPPPV
ncbi:MAG: hypothetical protein ACP5OU_02805 [Methanothrix sp.]